MERKSDRNEMIDDPGSRSPMTLPRQVYRDFASREE